MDPFYRECCTRQAGGSTAPHHTRASRPAPWCPGLAVRQPGQDLGACRAALDDKDSGRQDTRHAYARDWTRRAWQGERSASTSPANVRAGVRSISGELVHCASTAGNVTEHPAQRANILRSSSAPARCSAGAVSDASWEPSAHGRFLTYTFDALLTSHLDSYFGKLLVRYSGSLETVTCLFRIANTADAQRSANSPWR